MLIQELTRPWVRCYNAKGRSYHAMSHAYGKHATHLLLCYDAFFLVTFAPPRAPLFLPLPHACACPRCRMVGFARRPPPPPPPASPLIGELRHDTPTRQPHSIAFSCRALPYHRAPPKLLLRLLGTNPLTPSYLRRWNPKRWAAIIGAGVEFYKP